MTKAKIRKIVTVVEEVLSEMGQAVSPPTRRAAAIAVIENPLAGTYQADLEEIILADELGFRDAYISEHHAEAIYIDGAAGFTLSVQWHPEWNAALDPVSKPLFAAFGSACRDWKAGVRPCARRSA